MTTNEDNYNRAFMPAYAEFMQLQGEYEIPASIIHSAIDIYKRLKYGNRTQRRSREKLVMASIVIASDNMNYPLMTPWDVYSEKKYVQRMLKIRPKQVASEMYVTRLGSILGLTETMISDAIKIVKNEFGPGPAAAAVYTVSGVPLRKLERVAGVGRNYILRKSKIN